ncbi:MAG: DUF5348 domain-containing protein [Clostridiaceae bacterium]|nr:DUF5348 domain-containing protein [Clostridiaceae bacterium]
MSSMNEKYKQFKYEVEAIKRKVDKLLEDSLQKEPEDKLVFRQYEELSEILEDTIYKTDYYSRPVKSGELRKMSNDKFELVDELGKQNVYFSCGEAIECFVNIDEEMTWAAGRVEYGTKDEEEGYYFYCIEAGHPFLEDGMQARIRTFE